MFPWIEAQPGTGLVNHINCFVRQVTEIDMPGRQAGCRLQRRGRILYAMMLFIITFETLEDFYCFIDTRLQHINLLESPCKCSILFKEVFIFFVGGRTDATEFTATKHRLENICRIEGAAAGSSGTDNCMNFVDDQDGPGAASIKPVSLL